MREGERPGRYDEQAETYDLTRGASPTLVRALLGHLGDGSGRSLLDAAGGTGNYAVAMAARGFRVTVLDAQMAMLAPAAPKIGPGHAVAGDVHALPLADRSFDSAMLVNAIHLLARPALALGELRRVVREGPLLVTAFTRENLASLFVFEYFGLRDEIDRRMSNAELDGIFRDAGFGTIVHEAYTYTDTHDGSLNALHIDATLLADPGRLCNTSFWYRLDEDARRRGIAALRRDLRSGALEARVHESSQTAGRHGHGTLFAAWP